MTVSKTISLPLDLLNDVLEESEIAMKDFSGSVQMLLRIGVIMRREERSREQDLQRAEAKLIGMR